MTSGSTRGRPAHRLGRVNLTLPDWLAILALVVGLVGGVLGVIGIGLTVWIYQKATEVNTSVVKTQAEIAGTADVLKKLIDGLLQTMTGHLIGQNKELVERAIAVGHATEKLPSANGTPSNGTPDDLAARVDAIERLVTQLSGLVQDDIRARNTLPPIRMNAYDYMVPDFMKQQLRTLGGEELTVAPSERPPKDPSWR